MAQVVLYDTLGMDVDWLSPLPWEPPADAVVAVGLEDSRNTFIVVIVLQWWGYKCVPRNGEEVERTSRHPQVLDVP